MLLGSVRAALRGVGGSPLTKIILRDTTEADFPLFFQWQRDPIANRMAAFTAKDPTDREAFTAHWTEILRDDAIIKKTILFGGRVIGSIAKFDWLGKPNVTYWLGSEYWGRGLATQALSQFLQDVKTRPLYASTAKDNLASIRVLQKCGFAITGSAKAFANARGEEIEEVTLELK